MAVRCEFINVIIPIANIDLVYPGGFAKFKADNNSGFSGRLWHDDYLLRDGAMNPMDIEHIVSFWEKKGLTGALEVDGKKQWIDLCVVEGMFGGCTLPCEWIEFSSEGGSVFLKGTDKGEVVG